MKEKNNITGTVEIMHSFVFLAATENKMKQSRDQDLFSVFMLFT